MSRKRAHCFGDEDTETPKKVRVDGDVTFDEDVKFCDSSDESSRDALKDPFQTYRCIPHHLIRLMYQVDLSVLCSLRKSIYKYKYPSLSLTFGDSGVDNLSDITLCFEGKSVHIRTEIVDKYYMDNDISYAKLFSKVKETPSFYINNYFNSFVKYLISESDSLSNNVEYLIIYTNAGLNLTEERKLIKDRSRTFYPFKFDRIDLEECDILRDFLFTVDNKQGSGFYQFSPDKTNKKELLKRLELLPAMRKEIGKRKFYPKFERNMKKEFLMKLVFAVNQPNREELNRIVKHELSCNFLCDYTNLQEKIFFDLMAHQNNKNHRNNLSQIVYGFNLLMFLLHNMYLHKNVFSITLKGKGCDVSNAIAVNYKGRTTYVKLHDSDGKISYSHLFPSKTQESKSKFSVNKHLALFVKELEEDKDMRYFIIYTNANLDISEDNKLKKRRQSKNFYPLKFDNINMQKKKYKIFRNCSCLHNTDLCQFSLEETANFSNLLKLPDYFQSRDEEEIFSGDYEKEMRDLFLHKLLFAVNQPNRVELSWNLKNEIENSSDKTPYSYDELREIALRWLESHEFGHVTKRIMVKLLGDIKNNRSSYQKIQNKNIVEEIKFAKTVAGREGPYLFNQFLDFLIKGEGVKCLEVIRSKRINLSTMSNILSGSGNNAVKAFKDLYDLWFDTKGNKKHYLKTLEERGINLTSMSSILGSAGNSAAKSFQDLYVLWFDTKINKIRYLKTLENEGVNLRIMCGILNKAGNNAAKSFKDLYHLWFDAEGNKTQCIKTLEDEGVKPPSLSSVLSGAGKNAANSFKDLYELWFDTKGNKTKYLKSLEKEKVNLSNMFSILSRAGKNAATAFRDLYDLCFDAKGNKTKYLKTLEDEGINLSNMSSILHGAGINAAKAFKELYDLWFDAIGNKTQYLKTLEDEGVNLRSMSSILSNAGTNAAKSFKDLYVLWFDRKGNKTQYLKSLEKEKVNLSNMSNILSGAGKHAATAFRDLYDLCFDAKGNKTKYLKTLEDEGVKLPNVSSILWRSGKNAATGFKDLYDLWFDENGNKTQYLKTLEDQGVYLPNVSNIFCGAGNNVAKTFKHLYVLWFDAKGNKTQYLKALEDQEVYLPNISNVLNGAGKNAAKAFKDIYDLWFDAKGNKSLYVNTLENKEVNLCIICNILNGSGSNAANAFKDLYNLWFNSKGNKTRLLKHFINKKDGKQSFTLYNLSSILQGSGGKAGDAFEKFHNICFDDEGESTELLADFLNAGFSPDHLSCALCGAGARAHTALKRFHSLCFKDKGKWSRLLNDFCSVNISLSILSYIFNEATDSVVKFHDFCFKGKTKKYFNHFFERGRKFFGG